MSYFVSETCRRKCLRRASDPVDRWSLFVCSTCCAADIDGDGFITPEDRDRSYDMYCADGEDGKLYYNLY